MHKLKVWIPVVALALLALSIPDLASAQVKTGTTAGAATPVAKKKVLRARIIDPSVASCSMFGSNGKTPRPGGTFMTQHDHALIRAEHQMMTRAATQGNGDETVYYKALIGEGGANPKLNRLRVADDLGRKKGCLLSGAL
jgi:hypothetical protein